MSKTKQSDTDQQQFWQMVLETFKSSGLSVRQFCKQEGFSEPTFYSWRKRLGMNATLKLATSDLSNSKDDIQTESRHGSSNTAARSMPMSSQSDGSVKNDRKILTQPYKISAVENSAADLKDGEQQGFIEVKMQAEKYGGLELVLVSGNTLRIGSGADDKTLSGVISVLQKAGLC